MRTRCRLPASIAIRMLVVFLAAMAVCVVLQRSRVFAASQETMRFETLAIRPHKDNGDDASNRQMLPGGRFVATNTSVRTLVRVVFMMDDALVTGGPLKEQLGLRLVPAKGTTETIVIDSISRPDPN